jgi:hypothetical protein
MSNASNIIASQAYGIPVTLLASAARSTTAGTNGSNVAVGHFRRLMVLLTITSSTKNAGDTLDVYVDLSPDSGTTFINAIHFTQQAGNGAAGKYWAVLDPTSAGVAPVDVTSNASSGAVRPTVFGSHARVRWVIVKAAGDTPSHTFKVEAFGQ